MNHDNDDFSTKLYAIQPYTQTQSPSSSPSKGSQPSDLCPESLTPTELTFPSPQHFLQGLEGLRKIHSEQPHTSELVIGESNRKTMTSISSTIDILFSKIQKIKEEFSFALEKPASESKSLSQMHFQEKNESMEEEDGCKDKENLVPSPQPLRHLKAKVDSVKQKLQRRGPLESKIDNIPSHSQPSSLSLSHSKPKDLFQPFSPASNPHRLKIRDFILGKQIGSGKFGDVYISVHKQTNFICAIKKILKSTILQYGMIQQLTTQLRIHYSMEHPNVVKLYGHFQDQYHIFLMLELAPHGSLIDMLEMKEKQTAEMIGQVTQGLRYIHEKRIIHRDIKPENIVVSMGVPKLCDFGWATHNPQNTLHDTFCGTLDYVSPQMKDEGVYNQSIDIWSIGVLTYELLAGFPPFKHEINNWKIKGSKRKMKWCWDVLYPPTIGQLAQQFIEAILVIDPQKRMTLSQCKEHAFLEKYRQGEQFLFGEEEINSVFQ